MQLSLVSLNMWKCEGEYDRRLRLMAEGLSKYSYDLLLGQEVYESEDFKRSSASYLSAQLGLQPFFARARKKVRQVLGKNELGYSGLCIWSRKQPHQYKSIPLPSVKEDGERIAQVFILSISGVKIMAVNTHLTHLKGAATTRKEQLKTIVHEFKKWKEVAGIVLCGDFNSEKSSSEVEMLLKKYAFRSVFTDDLPTHKSGRCIDHILFYPDSLFSILKSAIILKESTDTIYPSDHFGIFVQFHLNIRGKGY